MLGAHGGMHQKWHQAYEESTHVPFIFHNPTLFSGRQSLESSTSHADVISTMLGLAGLDPAGCARRWPGPTTMHTRSWDVISRGCCWDGKNPDAPMIRCIA